MTYTLTGRYPLGDLTGRDGEHLRFVPSTTVVGDGNIVLPAPVLVTLDAAGEFSVDLIGTDDPAYAPSGWVWVVQELMDGGRPAWAFELTADADLADVTVLVTPPEYDRFTLTVADTITGAPGTDADVTISGSPPAQSLTFTIPRGDVGATGPPNVLDIGTVTTGAPGSSAAATITGTSPAQTLSLTIPEGDKGDKGDTGDPGAPSSLYNAHTILAATVDDDPQPLTVGASTLVGRTASGNIAALSVADVRTLVGTTRVTRPHTDDRLVEVWNGSAWSVVDYDSGWRDITGLLINGWLAHTTWPMGLKVRRTNARVEVKIGLDGRSASSNQLVNAMPSGFLAAGQSMAFVHCTASSATPPTNQAIAFTALVAQATANYASVLGFWGSGMYLTSDAIPTSLPGTLVSAASA